MAVSSDLTGSLIYDMHAHHSQKAGRWMALTGNDNGPWRLQHFVLWSFHGPRALPLVLHLRRIADVALVISSSIASTEHLFSELDGTP